MKNILLFAIFLFFFEISSEAQGLKGVEIGDYGLSSPMFGKSRIETTIFDVVGDLVVEKFNGKIYSIYFSTTYFSKENADKLGKLLKDKYSIESLQRYKDGTWGTIFDIKKISIMISPNQSFQSYDQRWAVVEIYDPEITYKVQHSKDEKINNNF